MSGKSRRIVSTILGLVAATFLVAGCVVAGPVSSLISASAGAPASPPSDASTIPTASPAATPRDTQRPAPTPKASTAVVTGVLTSGPTCPVETVPPNPSCAPKPVFGATVVAAYDDGRQVARAISNSDGSYSLDLPEGTYTLTPMPFGNKMMRAPDAKSITLGPGTGRLVVDFTYDTGIR